MVKKQIVMFRTSWESFSQCFWEGLPFLPVYLPYLSGKINLFRSLLCRGLIFR